MTPRVPVGTCPGCLNELSVPSFSTAPLDVRCPVCTPPSSEAVAEARAFLQELYAGRGSSELALVLSSNTGQYVTALLNGERTAARSFLANVIALGEMLLADLDGPV